LSSARNIREHTGLGTIYVEAMPRFARAAGLVDGKKRLTPFGLSVVEHDSTMAGASTQWLIHYSLCSPFGVGPAFWRVLFRFVTGCATVSPEDIRAHLETLGPAGAPIGPKALGYAATAFVGTYTRDDCLGELGVLVKDGEQLAVGRGRLAPTPVVAFAVADFWDHAWPGRASVNLSWLNEQGGPASLLLMNSGEMSDALREMQNAGLVEVHRVAPPYQVFRLWGDSTKLLERVYE
jgi:hypothetical protein